MNPSLTHRWRNIVPCLFVWISVYVGAQVVQADTIDPKEFETLEGLEVTLWATTPQLYNPTNFDFDAKGRMWVTEAVNYRHFANPKLPMHREEGDRVVVLTDSDGDGKADQSHTFVRDKDLLAPLGIAVIDNKVVVSCSPNLIVYTDVDRDTKFDPAVDKKEILLTGFGGRDHDHSLHSVTVGPDGWWYFNVGNAGPHTVTDKAGWTLRAGSAYGGAKNIAGRKSDDGRVWVGGIAFRMQPDGTGLQPIGHNFRNSYEQVVTSYGDVFQNDNDDPPACRTTWLMEFGNAGFSSADGQRSWQYDQRPGQSTRVAEWRQEDPGVMPAGDIYGDGAPTGIAFYENGAMDAQFPDGLLLSCESARGVVFGYVPKVQGAGYSLQRFDFLKLRSNSSSGGWFRPSDVAIGPDGAIYVSDWFDPGVGGHRMNDRTGSGSIYRIAPKGFRTKVPSFDLATTAGQIEALSNPSPNVRALGHAKLKEGGEKSKIAVQALMRAKNPFVAARALWLRPFVGKKMDIAASQPKPVIGVGFVDLITMRTLKREGVDFSEMYRELANSTSASVRRELALSLRDVPWEAKKETVKVLAEKFDGWDRWYLEALGIACEGDEAKAYDLLIKNDPSSWKRATEEIAWRLHPPQSVSALAERAMNAKNPVDRRKKMIDALGFISSREANQAMLSIAKEGPEDLRDHAAWWGRHQGRFLWKEFGLTRKFPPKPKVKRIRQGEGRPKIIFGLAGKPVFQSEDLGPEKIQQTIDVDIRDAKRLYLIVETYPLPTHPAAGKKDRVVMGNWINPRLQMDDGSVVELSTLTWAYATRKGKSDVPRIGVNAERQPIQVGGQQIKNSIGVNDKSVIAFDIEAEKVHRFQSDVQFDPRNPQEHLGLRFSVKVDRSKLAQSVNDPRVLDVKNSNASHGRALFFSEKLACSRCHMLESYGGEIGPDLTNIASKHATPVLMESILRPSAAISMGFETVQVATVEGKVWEGLLVSNGDPLVLKNSQGKYISIPKAEIEEQQQSSVSVMPEMKTLLTVQEARDLVMFLKETAKRQE